MTQEKNNQIVNRDSITSTIEKLQEQGGVKIKVEHTLIETLTIEVDSQGKSEKKYEKVQEDLKINSEPQTLLEQQPESQTNDQKETISQENPSTGEEKATMANVPNQTNDNDNNSADNSSSEG